MTVTFLSARHSGLPTSMRTVAVRGGSSTRPAALTERYRMVVSPGSPIVSVVPAAHGVQVPPPSREHSVRTMGAPSPGVAV